MKKFILIIAAALISVSAFAQFKVEGAMTLGGYRSNNNYNTVPAGTVRVLYDCPLGTSASGEQFFLSIGAGTLFNNAKVKGDNTKLNVTWLQVPVMFGSYYPAGIGDLYASIGVYYGFALSGKGKNGGDSINIISNNIDELNILKRNDFGAIGQIGYVFPIDLGIYVGYNRGFLNIAKLSNSEAKNQVIEVGCFYRF